MPGIAPAVRPAFDSEEERAVFLDALEESLRPLMRVVFRYGVTYQELLEVMRALYIYSLRDRAEANEQVPTASRLALMAGITKGEVKDLFERRAIKAQLRAQANVRLDQLTMLLGKWHDDPQFSTPYGAPLDLSLTGRDSFKSFDELLAASGTELGREEAIEALLTNKCAEIHSASFIRCVSRSYFPKGKDLSRVARLARLGKAVNSTYVHNLFREGDEPSFFEASLISDFPLSLHGRNSVLRQVRDDGQEFINGFDRWISSKQSDFEGRDGERYGVTAFFFHQEKESEDIAYVHRLIAESGGRADSAA